MKRRCSEQKQRRRKKPPAVRLRDIPLLVVELCGMVVYVLSRLWEEVRRGREQRKR